MYFKIHASIYITGWLKNNGKYKKQEIRFNKIYAYIIYTHTFT